MSTELCESIGDINSSSIASHLLIPKIVIICIGLVGNGIAAIFAVVTSRRLRHKATERLSVWITAALLVTDFLYLGSHLFTVTKVNSNKVPKYEEYLFKELIAVIIQQLFHTASDFINSFIALMRYICLCHPFKVSRFITNRVFTYTLMAICITYISNTTLWYSTFLKYVSCQVNSTEVKIVDTRRLLQTEAILWKSFTVVVYFIIPTITMGVCAALFFWEFNKYRVLHVTVSSDNKQRNLMIAHLLLVGKYYLLNVSMFFMIYVTDNFYPSSRTYSEIGELVTLIHFATTWIMSIFILPILKTYLMKCFRFNTNLQGDFNHDCPDLYGLPECSNAFQSIEN